MDQSKLGLNTREARNAGKRLSELRLVNFWFTSDWMTNWRELLSQSRSAVFSSPKQMTLMITVLATALQISNPHQEIVCLNQNLRYFIVFGAIIILVNPSIGFKIATVV